MLAGRMLAVAVWPIYLLAFFGVVRQRHLAFKVTPKGGTAQRVAAPMRLFRPHLLLAVVCAACVIVGFTEKDPSPILMLWAAANAVLLGAFVLAAAWVSIVQGVAYRVRSDVLAAATPHVALPGLIDTTAMTEGRAVASS